MVTFNWREFYTKLDAGAHNYSCKIAYGPTHALHREDEGMPEDDPRQTEESDAMQTADGACRLTRGQQLVSVCVTGKA